MVSSEHQLKNYDIKKETRPFLLTIKGVSGIVIGQSDQQNVNPNVMAMATKYHIEYFITLYNREAADRNGAFYGRTYRSISMPLEMGQGGTLQSNNPDYIYMHTSYTDKTSMAIVECVLCIESQQGAKKYASIGYTVLDIFEFPKDKQVTLLKGSPRSIGTMGLDQAAGKSAKQPQFLVFSFQDYPLYQNLRQLLPANCLCGIKDIVPGLQGDNIPLPFFQQANTKVQANKELIKAFPTQKLFIHNMTMHLSIAFERRFESFLKKMRSEKIKTARGVTQAEKSLINDNVYIDKRTVIVCVNNTWKNIVDEMYMSIGAPNEQGLSFSDGTMTINNFISHPLVSLVFRLEYKAIIPHDKYNEQMDFTLGWQCHLPQLNQMGEIQNENIELEFELGPGTTPGMHMIWDPNADDDINFYKIKMSAFVSTNAQPPPNPLSQSMKKGTVIPQVQQQHQVNPYQQQKQGQPINVYDNHLLQEKDSILRAKQEQIKMFEQKERETHLLLERLEMEKLRNQTSGGGGDVNNEIQRQIENQVRVTEWQNQQLRDELQHFKQQQADFFTNFQQQQVTGGHGRQTMQYGDGYITEPLNQSSAQHIAQIGNVFYNLLNMIGEQEKDKKIVKLSEEMKKFVQQTQFDDLLAPKVPFVGTGTVNLLKTTDLPLTDQINFIKMGYGDDLAKAGTQLKTMSLNKEQLTMHREEEDPLKASSLSFKFICFKTPQYNLDQVPQTLYFEFKFFTFPSLLTDKVKFRNANNQDHFTGLLPNMPYYLIKATDVVTRGSRGIQVHDTEMNPNLLNITFDVDSSLSKVANEETKLAKYLMEHYLTIDVFDGDSLFLYGTVKLPLFEMLRQGRGTVIKAKECELCDAEGNFKGYIQLIMSNVGRTQAVREQHTQQKSQSPQKQPPHSHSQTRLQPSQQDARYMKKVVKSKPMDLAHQHSAPFAHSITPLTTQMNQDQLKQITNQNPDLRKKLRVDRVKKMTSFNHPQTSQTGEFSSSIANPIEPDWQKFKSLREIERIRETKKDFVVKQVINEYVSTAIQVHLVPGELQIIKIPIKNPYSQNEVFRVIIDDPHERDLREHEVKVVTDQNEWKQWVREKKFKAPFQYDIINAQGELIIIPNEEVEVLLKLQSVRQVAEGGQSKTEDFIMPRQVKISVMQSNRQAYSTTELNIVPLSPPIDHVFRYFEPQNSHVSITIPPFLQLNYPGLQAVISKKNALIDINRNNSQIKVETKIGEAPNKEDLLIFFYGDQYREKLLAVVKLEIYALVVVYARVKAGIESVQTLAIPSETSRAIKIYSNNHQCAYMKNKQIGTVLKLTPFTINNINICTKTFTSNQERVRVHAVDQSTGSLIMAWLLLLDSERPTITEEFKIECKLNTVTPYMFPYLNKLSSRTTFQFVSSRTDFMIPKQEMITLNQREERQIQLDFLPMPRFGTADIYLFVSDTEQLIVQCYLFHTTYISH